MLAFLCSACLGGSGSSGFDATPAAENRAIQRALSERQCQPGQELTICPANEDALVVPGSEAPIVAGTRLVADANAAEIARCAAAGEQLCSISVHVSGAGLPGGAYQIAGRGFEPLSEWRISEQAAVFAGGDGVMFAGRIEFPVRATSFQVAVLVFADDAGTATGEIRTLGESGATLAFVSAPAPIPR